MEKNHSGTTARKTARQRAGTAAHGLSAELAAKIGDIADRLHARAPCTKYYARDVRPLGREAKPT